MDRISNTQSTFATFYRTDADPEDSSEEQDEERPAENPTGLIGDIAFNYDFSSYDLFDDDCLQREAELTGPSSVDS